MSKKVILTVDDEEHILELISFNLEINGYDVRKAETGEEALEILQAEHVDLVLLDRMLPGIDGIEVLRRIRQDKALAKLPVILLTAKTEEFDKVEPAPKAEEHEQEQKLAVDNLEINYTTRVVQVDGREVEMSYKEFELLYLLAANRNRVYSRDTLLEKIWGYDYLGETRTIDVHIRNLRKKVERDPDHPEHIKTVRGIGYKFV